MKKIILLFLLVPFVVLHAQKIGKFAKEEPPENFFSNQLALDLIFNESGFGLGGIYGYSIGKDVTMLVDFSISETKDSREIEYIDWWGIPYSLNKKNRSLLIPLNLGFRYRLFSETISENLRPYLSFATGPMFVVSSPYMKDKEKMEFFSSLRYAKAHYGMGGYISFGADFGLNKKSLAGINVRYYIGRLFGDGIENLENHPRKNIKELYISLNIGVMF